MVPMERLQIIVGAPRNAWPRLILILLFKNSAETKLNDNFFKKDLFMNISYCETDVIVTSLAGSASTATRLGGVILRN